jgi:hypothetical protein
LLTTFISLAARLRTAHHGACFATRALLVGLLAVVAASGLSGCAPDRLLGDKSLPPDVPDPAQAATPAGALAAYRGALTELRNAVGGSASGGNSSYIPVSGLLTDELRSGELAQPNFVDGAILTDSRYLPEDAGIGDDSITPTPILSVYGLLQKVRGQSRQARGALRAYTPTSSTALAGHLFAVEGYADVFLADLFCSGVPLSTLDFGGDFTYQPGSSTQEVYQHAITLFDSALTISADSVNVMNLARVGKGRALLDLGRYAEAAQAVADVPDDYRYTLDYSATPSPTAQGNFSNQSFVTDDFGLSSYGMLVTMVDREGGNGLPFLSSGDPRSAWGTATTYRGLPLLWPVAYPLDGSGSIMLASGVEARLIQSEGQLQAGDAAGWLATLNALRTNGTFDSHPDPTDSTKTDTVWHAGTGGVSGLAPLSDPGTVDGRVDLLFQERGYWFFLTGHRQGDLRRLVRVYGRDPERVYPTGPYPGAFNVYGTDVTAPIPGAERVSNPLFTGCRSRGA